MVSTIAATKKFPTLLLNTSEGLLLQFGYDPHGFVDFLAILRLPPSAEEKQAGIPGREVMRVRSDDTPRFFDYSDDQRSDVSVFIGQAMFSLPRGQAERLRASIVMHPEVAEESR